MALLDKQLVPGTFHHHLVARAHKKTTRRRMMILSLVLTPMVDMFSLLVIFLLQTFSTAPELLVVQKDMQLPSATTGREIKDAPVLSVTREGVFLDQKLLGTAEKVLKNPEKLMTALETLRLGWMKAHPKQKFPGEINLHADRDVASTTVSQLMGVLPSQFYSSIQLAVVSGSGS